MRNLHPAISFGYFAFIILITVVFLHPVMLGISLVSSLLYAIYLNGIKSLRFTLLFLVPMMLLAAIINPLFNHLGNTVLFTVANIQITLESTLYGLATAAMLAAVILWFSCYNKIMTSDKFIYLFGRIIPAISLIISMALRFIPRYIAQIKKISYAQRAIGRDVGSGRIIDRLRSGADVLSIMVTWALENGVDTADSMRSRGYGLKGRSAYSLYQPNSRDKTLAAFSLYLAVLVIAGIALRLVLISYFPLIELNHLSVSALFVYLAFLLLCLFPLLLDGFEELKWRFSRSRI